MCTYLCIGKAPGLLCLQATVCSCVAQILHPVEPPSLCRLVVSVTDYGIRVLAMPGGRVLHHLKLHTGEGGLMFVTGRICSGWQALPGRQVGSLAVAKGQQRTP